MSVCLSVGMYVEGQHGAAIRCMERAYGVSSRTLGSCCHRPKSPNQGKNRVGAAAVVCSGVLYWLILCSKWQWILVTLCCTNSSIHQSTSQSKLAASNQNGTFFFAENMSSEHYSPSCQVQHADSESKINFKNSYFPKRYSSLQVDLDKYCCCCWYVLCVTSCSSC